MRLATEILIVHQPEEQYVIATDLAGGIIAKRSIACAVAWECAGYQSDDGADSARAGAGEHPASDDSGQFFPERSV